MASEDIQKLEYYVVEFPEERDENGVVSMAIISSTCVFENNGEMYCYWPKFSNEAARINSVMKHKAIVNKEKSGKCLINIKFKSCDYQKAIRRLKTLEIQSNYSDTDEDEELKLKKLIKPNQKYIPVESSSLDNDELPCLPITPKVLKTKPIGKCKNPDVSNTTSLNVIVPEHRAPLTTNSAPAVNKITCHSCQTTQASMAILITKFEELQFDVKYLIRLSKAEKSSKNESTISIDICSTLEELQQLEENLTEKLFFNQMNNSLQIIGGKDGTETTRRILSKLISNELAKKCNWKGRNNKIPMNKFENIVSLIIGSVRQNPLSKNMSQKEVEDAIKNWLRTSLDRDGGRGKRNVEEHFIREN